jgi:hypothetical protein
VKLAFPLFFSRSASLLLSMISQHMFSMANMVRVPGAEVAVHVHAEVLFRNTNALLWMQMRSPFVDE